jgi:hypothetical protein
MAAFTNTKLATLPHVARDLVDFVDELDGIKDAVVLLELAIGGAREEQPDGLGDTGNALHTAACKLTERIKGLVEEGAELLEAAKGLGR